jgi:hypothetical protein
MVTQGVSRGIARCAEVRLGLARLIRTTPPSGHHQLLGTESVQLDSNQRNQHLTRVLGGTVAHLVDGPYSPQGWTPRRSTGLSYGHMNGSGYEPPPENELRYLDCRHTRNGLGHGVDLLGEFLELLLGGLM